jgi:hypothetical protein
MQPMFYTAVIFLKKMYVNKKSTNKKMICPSEIRG